MSGRIRRYYRAQFYLVTRMNTLERIVGCATQVVEETPVTGSTGQRVRTQ